MAEFKPWHSELKPWHWSFLLHAAIALIFVLAARWPTGSREWVDVPVFEVPEQLAERPQMPTVVLKSVNAPPPTLSARPVFGSSRHSQIDATQSDGIDAKMGNTLAKESDTVKLESGDADALPVPTEEFLVSQMPTVVKEVRPVYPQAAKDKRQEGRVVALLLVDAQGRVRDVQVIEGDEVFRAGAVSALREFLFKPAHVEGRPVAVRVRYTLKFELEY